MLDIWNLELGIRNSELGTWNWIRDAGFEILDVGCWMLDLRN